VERAIPGERLHRAVVALDRKLDFEEPRRPAQQRPQPVRQIDDILRRLVELLLGDVVRIQILGPDHVRRGTVGSSRVHVHRHASLITVRRG
jgi:hypothetical protein